MEQITKYWLFLFLLGNIFAQYKVLSPFADIIFYPLLGVSVISIMMNNSRLFISRVISTYRFIFIYIVILWMYQLTFGMGKIHDDTWIYLIAKTSVLLMTVICVEKNSYFYHTNFCKYYLLFCVVLLALGLTVFHKSGVDGRYYLGFANPNAGGHLAAICVAGFLMTKSFENKVWLSRCMMLLCLIAVLLSGSRASMGVVVVAMFVKYGMSKKMLIPLVLSVFAVTVVLPMIGVSFVGLERFANTVESQDLSSGREAQREAAYVMINEFPVTGNGICAPQSQMASMITELGSHNTYLDWLKWFGIPLGGLLIFSLLLFTLRLYWHYRGAIDDYDRFHLFVVASTVLTCYFEGYIWGVNEMSNTIFFVSLAVLDQRISRQTE